MNDLTTEEKQQFKKLKDLFVFHGCVRIKSIFVRDKMYRLELTVPSVITDKAQDEIMRRFIVLLADAFPEETFMVVLDTSTLMEFTQGKFYTNQSLTKYLIDRVTKFKLGSFYRNFFLMLEDTPAQYSVDFRTKESKINIYPRYKSCTYREGTRWKSAFELIKQLGKHASVISAERDITDYLDDWIDNNRRSQGSLANILLLSEQRHTRPGWFIKQ